VLLNASMWLALARGLCQGHVSLTAAVMLAAIGLVIAAAKRWRMMAHTAIGLGFVGLLVSVGSGLETTWSYAGLITLTSVLLVFQLRLGWLDTAISGIGASFTCLLVLAVTEQVTFGGAWPAPDVTLVAWLLAAAAVGGVGVVLSRRERSPVLAVITEAGALIAFAQLARQSTLWLLAPAALSVALGAFFLRSDRRSLPGGVMVLSGVALAMVVASVEAQGTALLCAGLACLGTLGLVLAAAQESALLQTLGWTAGIGQLVTLALTHPLVQGGAGTPWAPTWTTWCVIAGLIALELALASAQVSRGRLAGLTPRWIAEGLKVAATLLLGAVVSTAVGKLPGHRVLLTLLWAACAFICWAPPRRHAAACASSLPRHRGRLLRLLRRLCCSRPRAWQRAVGVAAGLAAVVKLFAWDWPLLDIVARLALLLLVGSALLIVPLLGRLPKAQGGVIDCRHGESGDQG
jgi:hypothetical protein